jgi:hypothetical protein
MLHLTDSSYIASLRGPTIAKPQTCIPQISTRRPSPLSRHLYPPPSQRLYTIYIYPIKSHLYTETPYVRSYIVIANNTTVISVIWSYAALSYTPMLDKLDRERR